MRVAIGVLTYRRPHGLRRLLQHLSMIEIEELGVTAEVLVVDNDPSGEAYSIVRAAQTSSKLPVRYLREERKGISYGRNRCIDESIRGGFDVLVFIDDDEVPSRNWLNDLIGAMIEFESDAVVGPVLPIYEGEPPAWVRKGRFFEPRRYPTGTPRSTAGTGNVAIRLSAIIDSGLRFDEQLALSGGEDSLFFARFTRLGYSLIWVDEAHVLEYIPRSRMTARWLLRRAFRRGTVTSFRERVLSSSPRSSIGRLAKGLGRLAQGVVVLPFAVFQGTAGVVKSAQLVYYGIGVVAGLLGFLYFEYADQHRD